MNQTDVPGCVQGVENEEVIIKLTRDQALVLSDWLERVQMTDLSHMVDDTAVWAPIHRLAGTLDKTLPEVFATDYAARLNTARQRLRQAYSGFEDAE